MKLLTDKELKNALAATDNRLVVGDGSKGVDAHGCAIELSIGDIFRPGTKPNQPGSLASPRSRYSLAEGETAVVRTLEKFELDARHTAVVFPVSSVSLKGLLLTNPGHVDPGYKGHLHVTAINMGREHYPLQRGARLLRALIFQLDDWVDKPWPPGSSASPVTRELLDSLSPDFLSVTARGTEAAKRAVAASDRRSTIFQFVFPAAIAALSAWGTAWLTNQSVQKELAGRVSTVEERLQKLDAEARIGRLEYDYPTEKRLHDLDARLKAMESDRQKEG